MDRVTWWAAAAVAGLSIAAGVLLPPWFEMRAFNKHSPSPKATYLDAVLLDLVVILDTRPLPEATAAQLRTGRP